MLPIDIFSHWESVRGELIATIEAFDESELDYVPFEGCKKVGDIMLHIASAEDGWLRYGITQEIDAWPEIYHLGNYPDKASIIKVLDEVHARTVAYLSGLSEADLRSTITAPWGDDFPLFWILWHVIEHEIHHRGELSIFLGYLGREGVIR
jgi:uncharacterized damage-inducible protein DinB